MNQVDIQPCGWYGTIASFLSTLQGEWMTSLSAHHRLCMNMSPDSAQIKAWENCFKVLQKHLPSLITLRSEASSWTIIFEYELPRERGRRPDVLILAHDTILVLEFKDAHTPQQAYVDQVAAYARDLRHYHAGSHHRMVIPLLLLTRSITATAQQENVWIVPPPDLPTMLSSLVNDELAYSLDPATWLFADYLPLPSLVSAARTIFHHEPLPQIRRAQSAGIPHTIAELVAIAKYAKEKSELHVAFVTGVPGAGKTLVGLQFVYENSFDDLEGGRSAVFLSGNGPLVKVLQHALRSSTFVQDIHGFLKQYGGSQRQLPEEHIWVYDEAQRAWDAPRVQEKRGHSTSEPEDFLRLGERLNSWAFLVGLIGEGQEIYLGEEAGLGQWNTAIQAMHRPWIVHCPQKISSLFTAATQISPSDYLDLTVSLRSHVAEDVQLWVKQVLEGHLTDAAATARQVMAQGFNMYVAQDLDRAKQYVRDRYQNQEDKRYGLLASSKAQNLTSYGIHNDYSHTKYFREGPWYNDLPHSLQSCCQLREVATEFACQGLELDYPIVGWGNDLRWRNGSWISIPQPRSQARDPHQLRINSYRVLLSRGRDGFVIFVPKESLMETTYQALIDAGVLIL